MNSLFWEISKWDSESLIWIQNNLRNDVLSGFFTSFTRLGNHAEIWIGMIFILIILRKYRKMAITASGSLLLTYVLVDFIIKPMVGRVRPYLAVMDLSRLVAAEKSFSFPSGHASTAFAVAYVLFRELPFKYGFPVLILAGLMAFSRMYVGVHYPSDVLVGIVVGILSGEICIWLRRNIVRS